MRGFGGPEGTLVAENVMDHIAFALRKDPLEVRQVNMTQPGDRVHYGDHAIEGCTLPKLWDECLKKGKFEEKRR